MKKLSDYLHFYLGCMMLYEGADRTFLSNGDTTVLTASNYKSWLSEDTKCKLVLRKLSDITEAEKTELQQLASLEKEDMDFLQPKGTAHLTNINDWAQGVMYLLAHSFDIFGLIEAGLAIDRASVK